MTDATRFQFNDPSVPKAYDELLVPRLFEPWAKLLLDEADAAWRIVLDVATGPGTVATGFCTSALGRILATDIATHAGYCQTRVQPPTSAPISICNLLPPVGRTAAV
jgi:hypothetical protein